MRILYPEGRKKALTFSYDDGQIFDRKLVEIFNRYQVKATFHLNSETLDQEGFVTKKEVRTLYAGHEIACHGATHPYFTQLSKEQIINEIWKDRRCLEALAECPVVGLSYPFGEYSEEVISALESLGIEYSRTVQSHHSFQVPARFMTWNPTCHHNDDDLSTLADAFLNPPDYMKLPLFYVWGHSFEFGRQNNWEVIENFCKKVSGKDDIWYATNLQIKRYLSAVRNLVYTADETMVYNPTAVSVWAEINGKVTEILPGHPYKL
jgi:hypothetical protein